MEDKFLDQVLAISLLALEFRLEHLVLLLEFAVFGFSTLCNVSDKLQVMLQLVLAFSLLSGLVTTLSLLLLN